MAVLSHLAVPWLGTLPIFPGFHRLLIYLKISQNTSKMCIYNSRKFGQILSARCFKQTLMNGWKIHSTQHKMSIKSSKFGVNHPLWVFAWNLAISGHQQYFPLFGNVHAMSTRSSIMMQIFKVDQKSQNSMNFTQNVLNTPWFFFTSDTNK